MKCSRSSCPRPDSRSYSRGVRRRVPPMSDPRCLGCGVALVEGDNWLRRWRSDRRRRSSNFRCRRCERAAMRERSRRPHVRFGHARRYAKASGHRWTICLARYRDLLEQPCGLCGGRLSETGVGLDRIDRAAGFIASNVRPACGSCLGLRSRGLAAAEIAAALAVRQRDGAA